MSEIVTLTLRAPLTTRLEIEGLTADRCATLEELEIAALTVWSGPERAQCGDFFQVHGGRSARVRIEGPLSEVDGLAAGTAGGEMVIDGDGGHRLAAGMTGGIVEVRGRAGDDAGVGFAGGVLRIAGGAGDRIAGAAAGAPHGMTGGEIIVEGSVGAEAAVRARRGLVVVTGDAGPDAGRAMVAGSLVVFGRTGARAGRGNKRGSLIALGGITIPDTYRYACTLLPPHVRLLMTHLRRAHRLLIDDEIVGGRYRRYCGDAGDPGKGEILEWRPAKKVSMPTRA